MSRAKKFFAQGAAALKAIEDAKPKPWEIEPFSGLDAMLILALAEKFHPGTSFSEVMSGKPKRFLDIAFNLAPKCQPSVMRTTVMPILKSARPFEVLTHRVDTFHMLYGAEQEFIQNKFHGMLIHKSTIYPVKVMVEDEDMHRWGLSNEKTLRQMVAASALEALALDSIECDVMLFAEWGFSNLLAEVKHSKNQPITAPSSSVAVIG